MEEKKKKKKITHNILMEVEASTNLDSAPANVDLLVWNKDGKPFIARKCAVTGNPLYAQAGRWYSQGLQLDDLVAWAHLPHGPHWPT